MDLGRVISCPRIFKTFIKIIVIRFKPPDSDFVLEIEWVLLFSYHYHDSNFHSNIRKAETWGGHKLALPWHDVKWRACDVGEAKEGLENELWRRWSNGRIEEWAVM